LTNIRAAQMGLSNMGVLNNDVIIVEIVTRIFNNIMKYPNNIIEYRI